MFVLTNSILFAFQSIFISFAFLTLLTFFVSFITNSGSQAILIITVLFNILIIYLLNFFKKNLEINRLKFIYLSIMCWILLITVSLLPLLELLENKSFNEKFFFATSLITTTGFDLKNYMYKDELILKIWVALIQCIGALYTILVFVMYFSSFLNKNNKIMVINKNNILLINLLFLFYLIFFTIILKANKFDLIEGFSLSASIFSSGGIRINNSIYLDYNINYF